MLFEVEITAAKHEPAAVRAFDGRGPVSRAEEVRNPSASGRQARASRLEYESAQSIALAILLSPEPSNVKQSGEHSAQVKRGSLRRPCTVPTARDGWLLPVRSTNSRKLRGRPASSERNGQGAN